MAEKQTRIGVPVDEKSLEQWPGDGLHLAGTEFTETRSNGAKEKTVVPFLTAWPTYADNAPNKGK
jgi:hypothetical protein